MAKFKEKIEAHKLRRSGESIGAIAQKLGIAKSTVSLWCREIELTAKQQKKLDQKIIESGQSGRSLGASVNKRKREVIITRANEKGDRLIKKISKRDLLFLGLGLYWGEGSKNTENRFILVNSDPFIIKAVIKWLKEVMSIPRELLTLQIYINEQHEYRTKEVLRYWSKELNLPLTQFRRPVFIHTAHKKIYANHKTYMGVLHLYVQKSSTLKYATMGMLGAIKKHV